MSQVTIPVPAKPPPAWDIARGAPGFSYTQPGIGDLRCTDCQTVGGGPEAEAPAVVPVAEGPVAATRRTKGKKMIPTTTAAASRR